MNTFKYVFVQTRFALIDVNERIKQQSENLVDNLIKSIEISRSKDDTFLYEFKDKARFAEMNGSYIQTYMISEFPQLISPNWLSKLANYSEPIVISQFIKPVDAVKAITGLRNRITNLSAQYYEKLKKGEVNTTELEQAIQDAKNVEDSIVRGAERLYHMSMYLKLENRDLKELEKSDQSIKSLAYTDQLKLYPLIFKQKDGIESILPNGINKVGEEFLLTSSNVSSSLPFTTATLNDPDGIFYGITTGNSKVRFDRFSKVSKNYNGIIFATSGAGKSFAGKLEIYRSLFRGIKVYVIDPEGEFKALCDFVGGTNVDINPESKTKVNPLQFFSTDTDSKETMRTHLGVVKGLIKIWLSNKTYNRGIVSKAVNETYISKGIILEDPMTYSNEAPTISDLIGIFKLQGLEGEKIAIELLEYSKQGELGDLYDNQTTTDVDFNSPLVVFNIQRVPELEKQATIFLLSNFIWQKVLSNRDKKILLIDEAHLLLKDESSASFIENLVRRGRKYNLGVICISQDVDDFLNHPQGNVIAKNAETALILAQKKQSIPSLVKAFDLSDDEKEFVLSLGKGQGLFIKGTTHSHIFIYPTAKERDLFSSSADDLAKLDQQRKNEQ